MGSFVARGGLWVAAQVGLLVALVYALRLRLDVPTAVAMVGWVLVAAGAGLGAGGLITLGPNLTPYPEPVHRGQLVERGAYRLVRHPIYGGICIGAAGLAIIRGSLTAAGVVAVMLAFFRYKARSEETRLEAAYPGYAEYRTRVRAMLVPGLL